MNKFKELMESVIEEAIDMVKKTYVCYICGKEFETERPKHKHTRKAFEDNGKGVVSNGNFYCKKCVKSKLDN